MDSVLCSRAATLAGITRTLLAPVALKTRMNAFLAEFRLAS